MNDQDPWGVRELQCMRRDALRMAIDLIGDRTFEWPGKYGGEPMRLKDYEEITVHSAQRFMAWILTGKY